MDKTSVILPCYNEEKIISKIAEEVFNFSEINPDYEFIFVNDGSTDKTLENLQASVEKTKTNSIKILSYEKNKGKGYAIRKGVQHALGNFICFMDSDLAYSLNHLEVMKKRLESCHVAIGNRGLFPGNMKRVDRLKIFRGVIYNSFSRLILSLPYPDMQAGFKGFHRKTAKIIFSKQKINDFSFDAEILYLAKKLGYKIGEIPAEVSKDHKRKQSTVRSIRDPVKMFTGLIKIRINDLAGKYG